MASFSKPDVNWQALLIALGGEDMLQMMINAADFRYLYHTGQEGLLFTYKAHGSDRLMQAKFIPMGHFTSSDMFASPSCTSYDVKIIVEELSRLSHYRSELVYDKELLIPLFERAAQTAISFS